jgi:ribosome-associated protein
MTTFELKDQEYIELNKLLKAENLVGTGGEAKFLIKNGEAIVNDEVETQVRKKLRKGDVIRFFEDTIEII